MREAAARAGLTLRPARRPGGALDEADLPVLLLAEGPDGPTPLLVTGRADGGAWRLDGQTAPAALESLPPGRAWRVRRRLADQGARGWPPALAVLELGVAGLLLGLLGAVVPLALASFLDPGVSRSALLLALALTFGAWVLLAGARATLVSGLARRLSHALPPGEAADRRAVAAGVAAAMPALSDLVAVPFLVALLAPLAGAGLLLLPAAALAALLAGSVGRSAAARSGAPWSASGAGDAAEAARLAALGGLGAWLLAREADDATLLAALPLAWLALAPFVRLARAAGAVGVATEARRRLARLAEGPTLAGLEVPDDGPPPAPLWARAVPWAALLTLAVALWYGLTVPLPERVAATGAVLPPAPPTPVASAEAGTVVAVAVAAGDAVREGDLLLRLERGGPRADLARLGRARADLQARLARLEAEAADAPEPTFPPGLEAAFPDLVAAERQAFAASRPARDASLPDLDRQATARAAEVETLRVELALRAAAAAQARAEAAAPPPGADLIERVRLGRLADDAEARRADIAARLAAAEAELASVLARRESERALQPARPDPAAEADALRPRLAALEAELAAARVRATTITLTAPRAGVVTGPLVAPGAEVARGVTLLALSDPPGEPRVAGQADARVRARLAPGQSVLVTLAGAYGPLGPLPATVETIGEPAGGAVPLVVRLSGAGGGVVAGQGARLAIETGRRPPLAAAVTRLLEGP